MQTNPSWPFKPLSGLALLAAFCSAPAMAALVTPVTVNLIAPGGATSGGFTDPTPVNASQSITGLGIGNAITASGGGNVGSLLLPNERVFLLDDSIRISSYLGDDTNGVFSTGWLGIGTDHARYEFTGLAIAGRVITGYTLTSFDNFATSGLVGVTSGTSVALFDTNADGSADKLTFDLDTLRFAARPGLGNSEFHADFRIELISATAPGPVPVPEPGSLAMVLAALAGLSFAAQRRRQGAAAQP